MKKIWARIGMSLEVTDTQYEVLRHLAAEMDSEEAGEPVYLELDLEENMVKEFLKRGVPDGDSYIPASVFRDIEKENKERRN